MKIRDISVLSNIKKKRIDLGIQLDSSIFKEFEKKKKYFNFLFSKGVDSIFEIFNFDKEIKNKNFSRMVKFLGKYHTLNNIFIKYADKGLNIR